MLEIGEVPRSLFVMSAMPKDSMAIPARKHISRLMKYGMNHDSFVRSIRCSAGRQVDGMPVASGLKILDYLAQRTSQSLAFRRVHAAHGRFIGIAHDIGHPCRIVPPRIGEQHSV